MKAFEEVIREALKQGISVYFEPGLGPFEFMITMRRDDLTSIKRHVAYNLEFLDDKQKERHEVDLLIDMIKRLTICPFEEIYNNHFGG